MSETQVYSTDVKNMDLAKNMLIIADLGKFVTNNTEIWFFETCPLGIQTFVHHTQQMLHYILLSPGLGNKNFIQNKI